MGIKYDPDNKFFNIDKETLDKEIRLISEELKNTGKSDDIVNKICLGKINKFKDDNSLLSQPTQKQLKSLDLFMGASGAVGRETTKQ